MSNRVTVNTMPPAIEKMYSDKILQSRTRACIHGYGLVNKSMSTRQGNTMVWSRFNPLNIDTTSLGTSGNTKKGQQLTAVRIDATIQWYGTFVECNEQVVLTNEDPILNIIAEKLGQFMKETDDTLIKQVLQATASIQRCTKGDNGDSPTEISDADMARAYQTMRTEDTWPCVQARKASTNIATNPTRKAYFALCHSDLISDFYKIPKFIEVIKYSRENDVRETELGSLNGFAIHVSSLGSIDPSETSVNGKQIFNIICMGKEAAGRVSLEGNSKFYYNPPIDPLRQNFTAGVKWVQVPRIFNDKYMLRVMCTQEEV